MELGDGLPEFESPAGPGCAGPDEAEFAATAGDEDAAEFAAEFTLLPFGPIEFALLEFEPLDEFVLAALFADELELFAAAEFLLLPAPFGSVKELGLALDLFALPGEFAELSRAEFRSPALPRAGGLVVAPRLFPLTVAGRFAAEPAGRALPVVSDH